MNEGYWTCDECGDEITQGEHNFSFKRWGVDLCRRCQDMRKIIFSIDDNRITLQESKRFLGYKIEIENLSHEKFMEVLRLLRKLNYKIEVEK